MGMRAHIACVCHALAQVPCAVVLALAVLLVATPAQARPRLFGTVEFQMDLKKQQNWLSAMERNRKKPIFFDEKRFNSVAVPHRQGSVRQGGLLGGAV